MNSKRTEKVRTNTNGGFLFIEIVIACAIFVFCAVVAMKVYIDVSLLASQNRQKVVANIHACNISEYLESLDTVGAGDITINWVDRIRANEGDGAILPKEKITVTRQLAFPSPSTLYQYTIDVSWINSRGHAQDVVLIFGRF
ncbi:hypothetical protein ACFL96_06415 [Thermoproteota archaeon]